MSIQHHINSRWAFVSTELLLAQYNFLAGKGRMFERISIADEIRARVAQRLVDAGLPSVMSMALVVHRVNLWSMAEEAS